MRRMFDVVLDKLNKAKEQIPQDLEYVKSLVAQMDEVVEKSITRMKGMMP